MKYIIFIFIIAFAFGQFPDDKGFRGFDDFEQRPIISTATTTTTNDYSAVFDSAVVLKFATACSFGQSDDWTIEFWAYVTGNFPGTSAAGIFSDDADDEKPRVTFPSNGFDGPLFIKENGPTSTVEGDSSASLLYNRWTHIVFVNDASDSFKVYQGSVLISDTLAGSYTGLGGTGFDNDIDIIGGRALDKLFFEGYIDEFRVWNTARTLSQVNANRKAVLDGDESGLLYYWTFDSVLTSSATANTLTDGDGDGVGSIGYTTEVPFDQALSSNYYYPRFIENAYVMLDSLYNTATGFYGLTWPIYDRGGENYHTTCSPVIYLIDALVEAYRAEGNVGDLTLAATLYGDLKTNHGNKVDGVDGTYFDGSGDSTYSICYIPAANKCGFGFQSNAFYIAGYKLFEELGDSTYYNDFVSFHNVQFSALDSVNSLDTASAGYGALPPIPYVGKGVVNTSTPVFKMMAFATAKGIYDHSFNTGDSMLWRLNNLFLKAFDSTDTKLYVYNCFDEDGGTPSWAYTTHMFSEMLEGMWYLREADSTDESYFSDWQDVVTGIFNADNQTTAIMRYDYALTASMVYQFLKNMNFYIPNSPGIQICNNFRNCIFYRLGFAHYQPNFALRDVNRDIMQSLSKNIRFLQTYENVNHAFPILEDYRVKYNEFYHLFDDTDIYFTGSNITYSSIYGDSGFRVGSSYNHTYEVKDDSNMIVYTFTKEDTTITIKHHYPGRLLEYTSNVPIIFSIYKTGSFSDSSIWTNDTTDTIPGSIFPAGDTTFVCGDSVLLSFTYNTQLMYFKANTKNWVLNKTAETCISQSGITRILIFGEPRNGYQSQTTYEVRNLFFQYNFNAISDFWAKEFWEVTSTRNTML